MRIVEFAKRLLGRRVPAQADHAGADQAAAGEGFKYPARTSTTGAFMALGGKQETSVAPAASKPPDRLEPAKKRPGAMFDELIGNAWASGVLRDRQVARFRAAYGEPPSADLINASPFPVSVHTTVGYFEIPPYSKAGFGRLTIEGLRVEACGDGFAGVTPAQIAADLVAQGFGMVQPLRPDGHHEDKARAAFRRWMREEAMHVSALCAPGSSVWLGDRWDRTDAAIASTAAAWTVIGERQVFAAVLMARIEGWELPPAVLSAQRHWRKVRAERVAEARKAQVAAIENAAKRNVAEAMKQFRRDLDAAINTDGMGLWPEGQSFHGEDSHGAKT